MTIVLLIFASILMIAGIYLAYLLGKEVGEHDPDLTYSYTGLWSFILIVLASALFVGAHFSVPTALDVYRGHTELKIKGKLDKEGMFEPTDSSVVYKIEEIDDE